MVSLRYVNHVHEEKERVTRITLARRHGAELSRISAHHYVAQKINQENLVTQRIYKQLSLENTVMNKIGINESKITLLQDVIQSKLSDTADVTAYINQQQRTKALDQFAKRQNLRHTLAIQELHAKQELQDSIKNAITHRRDLVKNVEQCRAERLIAQSRKNPRPPSSSFQPTCPDIMFLNLRNHAIPLSGEQSEVVQDKKEQVPQVKTTNIAERRQALDSLKQTSNQIIQKSTHYQSSEVQCNMWLNDFLTFFQPLSPLFKKNNLSFSNRVFTVLQPTKKEIESICNRLGLIEDLIGKDQKYSTEYLSYSPSPQGLFTIDNYEVHKEPIEYPSQITDISTGKVESNFDNKFSPDIFVSKTENRILDKPILPPYFQGNMEKKITTKSFSKASPTTMTTEELHEAMDQLKRRLNIVSKSHR